MAPSILPPSYRQARASSHLFIFLMTFLIPLVGLMGLVLGLIPALFSQQTSTLPTNWVHAKELALLAKPPSAYHYGDTIGSGQLAGILRYAKEENKRLQALIGTLSLDNQHALPLLRIALKDKDDNVRLLAYALLKRKEHELNKAIRASMSHLSAPSMDERFSHHKALASYFWELANLEASEDAAMLLCSQACEQAQSALALQATDAELQFLLGRLLLRVKRYAEATEAFQRASDYGLDTRKVMPYQAEIAFHEGRFSEISGYLKAMQFADGHVPLEHLAAYWNRGQHG
jgi:tetratricopeptide (TPR) repeat protein